MFQPIRPGGMIGNAEGDPVVVTTRAGERSTVIDSVGQL